MFLVVDGMSIGTFSIADHVMQRNGGAGSNWAGLWAKPGVRRSMMETASANSIVTDSAAGGSAWGCGKRVDNGAICFDKHGAIEPIFSKAKRSGRVTGVVSTARVTHATPASFYATVPNRGAEKLIAEQMLDRDVDLALGGGAAFVTQKLLAKHPDVHVVRSADEMRGAASQEGRLVGLFTDGHMSYELDRPKNEPHLKEMSMFAIDRLARHPGGFVLQIEAGRVDHGGHANDFLGSLHDQIAFEQTVAAVSKWAMARDDTQVIITTDHGTGSPDLTVYQEQASRGVETLLGAKHTLSWILGHMPERPNDWAGDLAGAGQWSYELGRMITQHVGVTLSPDEIAWALRPFKQERVSAFAGANSLAAGLGSVMANHFGVAYASTNHTAELVEATAFGPGSERLAHRIDNNELHALMTGAMAIK